MSESGPGNPTVPCAVVEELLPGYAQGVLNEGARDLVRGHVERCDLCSERLSEFERGEGLGEVVQPGQRAVWNGVSGAADAIGVRRRKRGWGNHAQAAMVVGGLAGVGVLGGIVVGRMTAEPPRRESPPLEAMLAGERIVSRPVEDSRGPEVASLLGVGDDETRNVGFSVLSPVTMRVQALGEGSSDQMYDYAWISNARTHEPVWVMEYGDTRHAGGAEKNREADHEVTLGAGDYVLHYTSDGSHSAHSWNNAPPRQPERWGVTLSMPNPRDLRHIKAFDPSAVGNALVRLVGARDDVHLRGEFALDRDADVRVYAIGEGMGGEMYDYAWLEDARTNRVVWEMRLDRTDHAGGADKNRMVNEIVRLPAGRYVAHYVTDGSHSVGGWNETPPRAPQNYGFTVLRGDR